MCNISFEKIKLQIPKKKKKFISLVKNGVIVEYLKFCSSIHTRFKLFIKTKNLNVLR